MRHGKKNRPSSAVISTPSTIIEADGPTGPKEVSEPIHFEPNLCSTLPGKRIWVLFLACIVLTALLLSYKNIIDLDIWWHLAAGRWMWEQGQVVSVDPFSYTFVGQKWVSITWGYEVLNYVLYLIAGKGFQLINLYHVLMAVGASACAWLSYCALEHNRSRLQWMAGFLVFFAGLFIVDNRWIHRPEMATHFFGAAMIAILLWDRRSALNNETPKNWIWTIPILQILWTNSHGIFIAGPGIVGAFWISKLFDQRGECETIDDAIRIVKHMLKDRLVLLLGVTLLACAINPLGFAIYAWPLHLLDVLNAHLYQSSIPEATNPLLDGVWGRDAWNLIGWGVLLVGVAVASISDKGRYKFLARYGAGHILLLLLMVKMSIAARRNIAWMVIWSLPVVADFISSFRAKIALPTWLPRLALVAPVVLVLSLAYSRIPSSTPDSHLAAGVEWSKYPEGALKFFRERKLQGRVFANVEMSDFLLFNLPGFEPYIDGRFAELYTAEHFQRYMEILAHPNLIEGEVEKWKIQYVALISDTPLAKGMIGELSRDPKWKIIYFNKNSVIFTRVATATPAELAQASISTLSLEALAEVEASVPSANIGGFKNGAQAANGHLQLTEMSILLGLDSLAKKSLDRAFILAPYSDRAWSLSCMQKFLGLGNGPDADATAESPQMKEFQQNVASTESACVRALSLGDDTSTVQTMGIIYLNTGRLAEAISSFTKVVHDIPASYEGYFMLGQAYAKQGNAANFGKMRDAWESAARLRPYNNSALLALASICEQVGDKKSAIQYYSRAQKIAPEAEIEAKIKQLEQGL